MKINFLNASNRSNDWLKAKIELTKKMFNDGNVIMDYDIARIEPPKDNDFFKTQHQILGGEKLGMVNEFYVKSSLLKLDTETVGSICVICVDPGPKANCNYCFPHLTHLSIVPCLVVLDGNAEHYMRHEVIHACFPPDAEVLTEGFIYKKIKDIRVGDLVFTHKGRLQKVKEVLRRNWQGTMREMYMGGDYRPIVSTREHPIGAIKRPRINNIGKPGKFIEEIPQFYSIIDLEKGDGVGMPFNNIVKDTSVFEFEKDPEFLGVLGLYLAEGDLDNKRKNKKGEQNGGQVRFTLHKKEIYFYERIKSAMEKYGATVGYTQGKNTKQNIITVYINGIYGTNIFKELAGEYSDKKKLNNRLMYVEPSLQYKIFEGGKDGDGHIEKGGYTTVGTVSGKLAEQMRIILLRNKIFSSLRYQKSRKIKIYNNKKYSITKPNYLISFGKKQKCGFIKGDCIFVAIKSIKDICHKTKEKDSGYDLGYVYNLEVENDNSYQVNGVAVHNCHQYISQHGIRLPDTQDSDLVKAKLSYSIMTPEAMAIEKQNLQDCLPYLYLMKNRPLKFNLLATLQQTTIALLKKVLKLLKKKNNRVGLISEARKGATIEGVDPQLLCAVIEAESNGNPRAINRNVNGTTDYGVCQINDYGGIGENSRSAKKGEFYFPSPEGVMDNPSDCILGMAKQFAKGRERDWCAYDNGSYIKFLKKY